MMNLVSSATSGAMLADSMNRVLATYVEHQDGARNTTPSSNTRISTVLFRVDQTDGPLTWLHIHETWVPPEAMATGPYDF